jgi:hypothetical protein
LNPASFSEAKPNEVRLKVPAKSQFKTPAPLFALLPIKAKLSIAG